MRPFELLPLPAPAEYDPSEKEKDYFYKNFVKPLIPDMIQLMDTGLHIDENAVEELRKTIDSVLLSVEKRLAENPLIIKFQQAQLPAAQRAWAEAATQSVRTYDYYLKPFNSKDVIHRTWVINYYLEKQEYYKDTQEKWTVADLKKYNANKKDSFLKKLIEGEVTAENNYAQKAMRKLAKYKAELWNRPRYEKAAQPVVLAPFNPASNVQVKQLFHWLGIEPLEHSKKTGEASWGRRQLEEIQKITTDKDQLDILEAFIDFSYSAIIKNNFLKAFDAFTIDGVLHGNIRLFGAKSFRPTSNSPNLLNAPSTGSIYAKPLKKCFIASEKFIVLAADLNGLEDRVIANLSGDENKQAVFLENLDGHSLASTYYFKERL